MVDVVFFVDCHSNFSGVINPSTISGCSVAVLVLPHKEGVASLTVPSQGSTFPLYPLDHAVSVVSQSLSCTISAAAISARASSER